MMIGKVNYPPRKVKKSKSAKTKAEKPGRVKCYLRRAIQDCCKFNNECTPMHHIPPKTNPFLFKNRRLPHCHIE